MNELRKNQSGQALILMIVVMTIAVMITSFFTMDRSTQVFKESIQNRRRMDVMYVLNATAQWLHEVYFFESNCDPYVLNNKINALTHATGINTVGRKRTYTVAISQGRTEAMESYYEVSIGPIRGNWQNAASGAATEAIPLQPQNLPEPIGIGAPVASAALLPTYYLPHSNSALPQVVNRAYGPQDTSVTYWTAVNDMRYEQTITLINRCTDPAGSAADTGLQLNELPGPQYGEITGFTPYLSAISNYAGALTVPLQRMPASQCSSGNLQKGALATFNLNGNSPPDRINKSDLNVLRKWVRLGSTVGAYPPAIEPTSGCLDLNNDGAVNDIDVNILEKSLKGYLYYNVVSDQH